MKVEHFRTTREVSEGHTEAYTLTCESATGRVRERRSLVIGRGQTLNLALTCGQ
ncbi:hypothetical protein [Capillimicrobium parvum]|uniref:Uncharacterized protein n=1 Tax=Capillimicrobium parvum TaxID=2884022 RepID=A0A9E6Y1X9_9ACTN|nr:hypothetical protein [Capillimicrobium parvum]UGS38456.1 hypothetical protein DSM104329_04885 [Capillimicrobium parvum]